MKIFVKAKPDSGEENIEEIDKNHFVAAVKEPPIQGRANSALIKVLADYFKVNISQVKLIRGFRERNKIFEIRTMKN